jgi:hypothetical protein
MKTIQLDQEFIDKIVVQELKEYKEVILSNMRDYEPPYMSEDLDRHIMVIAALDIVIREYTV